MAQAMLDLQVPISRHTHTKLTPIVEKVLAMFPRCDRLRILNGIKSAGFFFSERLAEQEIATFILLYIRWEVLRFDAPVNFSMTELIFPNPIESQKKLDGHKYFQELVICSKYSPATASLWSEIFHRLMDIIGKKSPRSPLSRRFNTRMPDEEIYRYFCRIYNKEHRLDGDYLRKNVLIMATRLDNY